MGNKVKNIINLTGHEQEIKSLLYLVRSSRSQFDFEQVIATKVFAAGQLIEIFKTMYVKLSRWGCTSNASEVSISNNCISFVTNKTAPHKIVQELSELFPDLEIKHKWAEECIGVNCGEVTYYKGSAYVIQIEQFSQEAYEVYIDCWGNCDEIEQDVTGQKMLSSTLLQSII